MKKYKIVGVVVLFSFGLGIYLLILGKREDKVCHFDTSCYIVSDSIELITAPTVNNDQTWKDSLHQDEHYRANKVYLMRFESECDEMTKEQKLKRLHELEEYLEKLNQRIQELAKTGHRRDSSRVSIGPDEWFEAVSSRHVIRLQIEILKFKLN